MFTKIPDYFSWIYSERWNTAYKVPTKCIKQLVSLRDEIVTDGFGMALIELLCITDILIAFDTEHNKT